MKRLLALALVLGTLFLYGCSAAPVETTPSLDIQLNTTEPSTEPTQTTTPTETVPEPTETEPTEPELLYWNPYTGEPLEALSNSRTFCVVFNNTKAALPQHGMGAADIVYETMIEGETRFMGVFYDLPQMGDLLLGSCRSARTDFVRLAMGHDGIFAHYGCSENIYYGAKEYFNETGWNHLEGMVTGKYFFSYRQNTHAPAHTHFTRADLLVEYAESRGFKTVRDNPIDMGWQFDDEAIIVGQACTSLTAWFNQGTTHSNWNEAAKFIYDAETGLYDFYHHYATDTNFTSLSDGNTGESIAFRNVLILKTRIQTLETSHMKIDVTGSGSGYFAVNGQVVPIRWSRGSETEPFVFTLENGTPITFGVGKTYIGIVPNNGHVIAE